MTEKRKKRSRIYFIPAPVKILLVVVMLIFVTALGLMIGYGVLGDGEPGEVLTKEPWLHIMEYFKSGK